MGIQEHNALDSNFSEELEVAKTTSKSKELLSQLIPQEQPLWFSDKTFFKKSAGNNPYIKKLDKKPGIYTIWSETTISSIENIKDSPIKEDVTHIAESRYRFMYVGMSMNLGERLKKHRNGTRGGNIFAIYVADRLILKKLAEKNRLSEITEQHKSLDHYVAYLVQRYFGFKYILADTNFRNENIKQRLIEIETEIKKKGLASFGTPELNPSIQEEKEQNCDEQH